MLVLGHAIVGYVGVCFVLFLPGYDLCHSISKRSCEVLTMSLPVMRWTNSGLCCVLCYHLLRLFVSLLFSTIVDFYRFLQNEMVGRDIQVYRPGCPHRRLPGMSFFPLSIGVELYRNSSTNHLLQDRDKIKMSKVTRTSTGDTRIWRKSSSSSIAVTPCFVLSCWEYDAILPAKPNKNTMLLEETGSWGDTAYSASWFLTLEM